jgi:hypothetical protein
MYNTNGKENAEGEEEEEDVKGIYILVSGTLAVVTSAAVNGTTSSSIAVVHVKCSLYPKIHLWYYYSPTIVHLYRYPDKVLSLSSYRMICANPFAFIRVLSIAVIERSTRPSSTNRCPIVDILCLISIVEMVFNRLSNVRLLGIDTRPQASTSLRLY